MSFGNERNPSFLSEDTFAYILINRLLSSENPWQTLAEICKEIPQRFPLQMAVTLWNENRRLELLCLCLPALSTVLKDYHSYGINEQDLFQEGFFAFQETVRDWSPKKCWNKTKQRPIYPRSLAELKTREHLEKVICQAYGLGGGGEDDFKLVQLYRECWSKFHQEHQRPASLKEIINMVCQENKKRFFLGKKNNKICGIFHSCMVHFNDIDREKAEEMEDKDLQMEDEVLQRVRSENLLKAVQTLHPREVKVLHLRFGKEFTLEQTGQRLELSRERIHQIELKAIRRLRNPSRRRIFGYEP